jgi:hypothetical protein
VDFASLQVFKALHGHLLVPESFSLSPDTPGVGSQAPRLGQHVKHLRQSLRRKEIPDSLKEDRALLSSMGFVWNANEEKFRRTVDGIVTYRKLFGNYIIPHTFVVPTNQPAWPKALWGINLGEQLYNISREKLPPHRAKLLTAHGISLGGVKSMKAERVLSALKAYKVYANIEPNAEFSVPKAFVVPHGDTRWDASMWGLRLGAIANNIRYYDHLPTHREQFLQIGLRIRGVEGQLQAPSAMHDEGDKSARSNIKHTDENDEMETAINASGAERFDDEHSELNMSEEEVAARMAAKIAARAAEEKRKADALVAAEQRARARAIARAKAEAAREARQAAAEERACRAAARLAAREGRALRRTARLLKKELNAQKKAERMIAKAAADERRAQRLAAKALAEEKRAQEEAAYEANIMARVAAARKVMEAAIESRKRASAARVGLPLRRKRREVEDSYLLNLFGTKSS